jgi:aldehyde:ferredoxin oxidoreductase
MFQPAFDTTTEDQVGWDQIEFGDVLATLDAAQQAEEVGPSQLTQASVWTQPT